MLAAHAPILLAPFGTGTPAGRLLGREPRGLAVDFANRSALIRGSGFNRKGAPDDIFTCVRSGTAYCTGPTGLLTAVAANTLRYEYDPLTLQCLGLLVEEQRTNVALWNRDLTNGAWTPSNITAAKDQTGIDGAANSASSITATAGNGTILQAITLASSARYQSAYVKRITGSGTINMTMDNGTTWTAVTVTSSWTRVTIPTQTLANPTIGFRIVTNGDAIAVDYVQNESGIFATSAIATTSAQVTRSADDVYLATTAFPLGTVHSMWARGQFNSVLQSNVHALIGLRNSSSNGLWLGTSSSNGAPTLFSYDVGTQALITNGGGSFAVGTQRSIAGRFGDNDFQVSSGGGLGTADTSGSIPSNLDRLYIGLYNFGGGYANGIVSAGVYVPRLWTDAELAARST